MQLKVCSCARVISLLPKWTEGQKRAEKSEEAFYKPARATSNEMYKISLSSRVSLLQSWNQKKKSARHCHFESLTFTSFE